MSGKINDILLLGSTGYTGKMVLEYFLRNYNEEIKKEQLVISCGVRNVERLRNVIRSIVEKKEKEEAKQKEYSILNEKIRVDIVDVNNYNSVLNACLHSKIVINVTGPYSSYGYNIVRGCVEAECHYVDATGEHNFILRIIKDFNEIAKKKKLKIIHSASFISALSDLGNFILQNEHLKKYKKPCEYIRVRLSTEGSEYATIGKTTVKSAIIFHREIGNTYHKHYLCDNKYEEDKDLFFFRKKKKNRFFFIDYEEELGYCFPTIYSKIEEAYVLWSNYLLNYKYGKNFIFDYKKYDPNINVFTYILKKVTGAIATYISSFQLCTYFLQKYVENLHTPKTSDELKKAFWKVAVIGESLSEESAQGQSNTNKMYLYMSGQNEDPGYLLTAKIISESALTLLQNGTENENFGVITISVGLGNDIVQRLKRASINMNIEIC